MIFGLGDVTMLVLLGKTRKHGKGTNPVTVRGRVRRTDPLVRVFNVNAMLYSTPVAVPFLSCQRQEQQEVGNRWQGYSPRLVSQYSSPESIGHGSGILTEVEGILVGWA